MLVNTAVFLLVSVTLAYGSPHIVSNKYLSSITNDEEKEETCTSEYACTSCTGVRLCKRNSDGSFTKLIDFECSGNTPYCNYETATCVSSLASNLTCAPESDFLCPRDGFYPDPTNCHKYYRCYLGKGYTRDCGSQYFVAQTESCETTATCYNIQCTGRNGVKVIFQGDNSFFGYCVKGSVYWVDKCPGQFKFDQVLQSCVPQCTSVGNQGDPFDTKKYYNCAHVGSTSTLTLSHLTCPENEIFDNLNSQCAPVITPTL